MSLSRVVLGTGVRSILTLAGVAAVLSLAACSSDSGSNSASPSVSPSGSDITLTGADHAVSAKVGQKITVVLEANSTTGYEWTVSQKDRTNRQIAKVLSGPTYAASSSTAMGAPGTATTVIEAVAPGVQTLIFTYARSFAPADNPTVSELVVTVS